MPAPLVRFDAVSIAFGEQKILVDASLAIESNERVCLIGRNGAGKSTTLKLITGELEPDAGKVERPSQVRLGMLEQSLADASDQTARDFVALGMAAQSARIERFERLSTQADRDRVTLRELEDLEREIEAAGGWSIDVQVDRIVSELELPGDRRLSEISGGWRRRIALGRALVANPALLLLDEPTNHLDISTIEWLEDKVRRFAGAVVFVTHDRTFVEHVATRIVDIDRGALRSWPGGYRDYLGQKRKGEQDEDRRNAEFDKKLAEEEAWIRQGVKAREHRNEGRVRALEALREERAMRIARPRAARISINESEELSGKKVIDARNVTHAFGSRRLLDRFSLRVMRGDRLGIIGNNGVGKSTLLRILIGELQPDSGTVKLGTNLEIGYFDQLRRELDPSKTVAEIIGEGREYISMQGRSKHVVGYLTDFLFTAKRAMTPIAALSGGERNRVILAKLFTRPLNLLVLDEPTNDLDIETLEALEARLAEYEGTLLVVSHDRHFLDAVVTSTLVFEADGGIKKHAGGYSDWARRHRALAVADTTVETERPAVDDDRARSHAAPQKLSYKLQRELAALPDEIDKLEARLRDLQARLTDPGFYRRAALDVQRDLAEIDVAEQQLDAAIDRWSELEELAEKAAAAAARARESHSSS
jgi:ABC transport system ATP-binding/permease protein